jgi:hypothetical protein
MAENMKNNEGRTLVIIRNELVEAVDKYNLSSDADERATLELSMKKLVEEWNELSLLTAYSSFLEDAQPLVAFGKAYTYATISTKDHPHKEVVNGIKRTVHTMSVEDGVKQLSLTNFIGWAQESNKTQAADKLWIEKWGAAREEVNKQWKRIFASKGENSELQIGKMRRALQALFDALVFIEAAGGSKKNALFATGNMAKYALALSNVRKVDLKEKTQKVQNMSSQLWEQIGMDIWHQVCAAKTYEVVIGDEKPEEEAEDKKPEDAAKKNEEPAAK